MSRCVIRYKKDREQRETKKILINFAIQDEQFLLNPFTNNIFSKHRHVLLKASIKLENGGILQHLCTPADPIVLLHFAAQKLFYYKNGKMIN